MSDLKLAVKIKGDASEFAGGIKAAESSLANFAGNSKKNANSASKSVRELGSAYETLGIKSIRSVGKEIIKVRAAYQRLADSGKLS
ncbi:MAG: hypothetical protein Q9N02_08285, partial [Ghiorsea sp.]|nr:hypothetical protein [Ghiorsea sp.]